jgi:hypothetical protein
MHILIDDVEDAAVGSSSDLIRQFKLLEKMDIIK